MADNNNSAALRKQLKIKAGVVKRWVYPLQKKKRLFGSDNTIFFRPSLLERLLINLCCVLSVRVLCTRFSHRFALFFPKSTSRTPGTRLAPTCR